MTSLSERDIEQRLVKAVKAKGGLAPKFVSPGFDGVPDRIVLLPRGRIAFVELKAKGRKMRPSRQDRFHRAESQWTKIAAAAGKAKKAVGITRIFGLLH